MADDIVAFDLEQNQVWLLKQNQVFLFSINIFTKQNNNKTSILEIW